MSAFPSEIQYFGRRFVFMQGQRQLAEYSPSASFSRGWVVQAINETEDAIDAFEGASNLDRRAFAIHVLFRARRD